MLAERRLAAGGCKAATAEFNAALVDLRHDLARETDLRFKVEDLTALRDGSPAFAVPRVHRDLSTSRLLVSQAVSAPSLEVLLARWGGAEPESRRGERLALSLVSVWLHQALLAGCFPIALRPQDVAVTRNRLIFTGVGVGSLSAEDRETIRESLGATVAEDPDRICDVLAAHLGTEPAGEEMWRRFRQLVPLRGGSWRRSGGGRLAGALLSHWRLLDDRRASGTGVARLLSRTVFTPSDGRASGSGG